MNWQIIKSNITEARQELERIEKEIDSADPPEEAELFLMLEHAYHHLNFAWNIRDIPTERYASMSDEEFERWGKFPTRFDVLELAAEASGATVMDGPQSLCGIDQEATYCCEKFKEAVSEGNIKHADDMPDETKWYLPETGHIYFCPFCGKHVKGEGFGTYDEDVRKGDSQPRP